MKKDEIVTVFTHMEKGFNFLKRKMKKRKFLQNSSS